MPQLRRLLNLFRRAGVSQDIDAELQFHIDERVASSGRSILLSQGLVRRLWPDGGDPIGRLVRLGSNPPFSVVGVRPLRDVRDASIAPQRLNAVLTGAFALLALALGAVGVAGMVSYAVIQRTPEMAIRMALGATPTQMVQLLTIGGLRLCLVGLLAGLAGASALGRAVAGQLYQVRPGDPAILGGGGAVLLAAAALASWLPARRIARVDPIEALRQV